MDLDYSSKSPYLVMYEDDGILVVYKKKDVFSIRTEDKKTFSHNLYHYLKMRARKQNEDLFIVHRLDYETSGVMVFAKTGKMKEKLQSCFEDRSVIRLYEGVTESGLPIPSDHEVRQYLTSGKGKIELTDEAHGKEAITLIHAQNQIQIGTALKIEIRTGRRNQIRLAMKSLGYPLLGDTRYGGKEAKRLYLNAYCLSFPESIGLKENTFFASPLWIKEKDNL